MDQQDHNQQRIINENVKAAMGELTFLCGWVNQYPQLAGQLALEAHELARRYVEEPTPDIEFRSVIPVQVWKQFTTACRAAESTDLNEEACYHQAEDLLFKALQDFIALHSGKSD